MTIRKSAFLCPPLVDTTPRPRRIKLILTGLLLAAALSVFLLYAWMLPRWEHTVMERANEQEFQTAAELCGAVTAAHPELELPLIEALQRPAAAHREAGTAILEKYGYTGALQALDTSPYPGRNVQRMGIFVLSGAAVVLLLFLLLRAVQERRIRRICLSFRGLFLRACAAALRPPVAGESGEPAGRHSMPTGQPDSA